jgi:MHS family proline/betaine transporter-like MFS transporter
VAAAPLRTSWKALLYYVGFLVLKAVSSAVTVVGLLAITILVPVFGLLSDRIGRKPGMLLGCVGFVVLTYPTLVLMSQGTFWAAAGAMILLGVFMRPSTAR